MTGSPREELIIAAVGDIVPYRRIVSHENSLPQLFELLQRADVTFGNLESLPHGGTTDPAAQSGGYHIHSPLWMADELERSGFDILACASNHTGDYSADGVRRGLRQLRDTGIAYTGIGETLAEAREPNYVDIPEARIGCVSASTAFPDHSVACHQRPDHAGRPGISPLRVETNYVVPEKEMSAIVNISRKLGLEKVKNRHRDMGTAPIGEESDHIFWNTEGGHISFNEGDEYRVEHAVNERDETEYIDAIRRSKKKADVFIASLHSHSGAHGKYNDDTVPDFHEDFSRKCIDCGADAVFIHGSHMIKGIEIYDEKPIFYGLGNFIFEVEQISSFPADAYRNHGLNPVTSTPEDLNEIYFPIGGTGGFLSDDRFWQSFVPVCTFIGGKLTDVDLYPVSIRQRTPSERGRPQLASGPEACSILKRLMRLSEPYGTTIELEGDHAKLRLE